LTGTRAGHAAYRKHLGIYAYRRAALERFALLPPSPLELTERLEQLRLLENGIALYVAEAPATPSAWTPRRICCGAEARKRNIVPVNPNPAQESGSLQRR
jgi:hypothetical protein